jgi:predicted Fe-Mo cluster-binding NifX family protein
VDFIVVAVNDGDLVDYQCEDADHNEVEPGEGSAAALSALFESIANYGVTA